MLNPDSRLVAFDFLVPPTGSQLDFALFTTFTLDLEVMLALPLQLLSASNSDIQSLHSNPIRLAEALREVGEKIHVFADRSGIAVPRSQRELYSMLESSLHTVSAPNDGVFHPKLWILRFESEEGGQPTLRLAVLSRNLTLDRSWDVAIVSEATPYPKQIVAASRDLAHLVSSLPAICTETLTRELYRKVMTLSNEIGRTLFPAPDGFDQVPIEFHALGLSGSSRRWRPAVSADRILAIAPFVKKGVLDSLPSSNRDHRTLVSKELEFDKIPYSDLEAWDSYILHEGVEDEPDDFFDRRPSGLHAKILAFEKGQTATWYFGSANLTDAAFFGRNVEVMACLKSTYHKRRGQNPKSIDRFLESGFNQLLSAYTNDETRRDEDQESTSSDEIEVTKKAILDADLCVHCGVRDTDWRWSIRGSVVLPINDVIVHAWPITLAESFAKRLDSLPLELSLTTSKLTSLVAFRLHDRRKTVDDVSFVVNLPAEAMPDDRVHHLLVSLINDWDSFRAFLKVLLGGVDEWAETPEKPFDGDTDKDWSWKSWSTESLLEDLLRNASRHPERLEPIRRLVKDVQKTKEGQKIMPGEFVELWKAVSRSIKEKRKP